MHPTDEMQKSSVHSLPSSEQVIGVCLHPPVAGSQASAVHPSLSLQSNVLPAQMPPAQVSSAVHAFPSLQGSVLFAWTHPVAGTQVSVVHGFPSSQFSRFGPVQAPPPLPGAPA
jgi:hypothetical protein